MPQKIVDLLKSRKFWTLIAALAVIGLGLYSGGLSVHDAVMGAIAALSAYCIGTGLDVNTNGPAPL